MHPTTTAAATTTAPPHTPPPCHPEPTCGERPGCYGGLRDGRECRTDADCPSDFGVSDRHAPRPYCVPLSHGCLDAKPCKNCPITPDTSRVTCETCLVCTPDEAKRGRAGCCGSTHHRSEHAHDDDDDDHHRRRERREEEDVDVDELKRNVHGGEQRGEERGRPICDRTRANFTEQCGRKFVCECSRRPCTDQYDVFNANEHFGNVCNAAQQRKLTALSRHGLPGGHAFLFTDGSGDFYFFDAVETTLVVTVAFNNTAVRAAGGTLRVLVGRYSEICPSDHKPADSMMQIRTLPTDATGTPSSYAATFSVEPGKFIVEVRVDNVPSTAAAAFCMPYDISAVSHSPVCDPDTPPCSLRHCFSARECPEGTSFYGCDSLRSRCIESIYGDDHDDDDMHGGDDDDDDLDRLRNLEWRNDHSAPLVMRTDTADCVCAGARDGTPCVNSTANAHGLCTVGACTHERCAVSAASATFVCDCTCPPRCSVDAECNDGNPHTDDFCIRNTHQCVNSPAIPRVPRNRTSSTTTGPTPVPTGVLANGTFAPPPPPGPTPIGGTPLSVKSFAASPAVTAADRTCATHALDAAERAYAAASMDRIGAFNAQGDRVEPLCLADSLESASILISSRTTPRELEATDCCAATTIRSYCLGGNEQQTRTGRQWSDAAYLALDNAHRAAQAGAATLAVRDACCAAMIYEAMGAHCGRVSDVWGLASAAVARIEEFADVGARCVATDDGHPDKDLNDFVFELRRVDLVCERGARLCAVNLHTLPLAHGGGHRMSLVVATGDELSLNSAVVDNGNCPARLRAVMPSQASAAIVRRELGARTPALPSGSFGERVVHALHDPVSAAGAWSECVTIGPVGKPHCARGDVLSLYDNTRAPFPLSHPDALEWLNKPVDARGTYREATTNTQRGTRRVRALFAVSATLVVAPTRDGLPLPKPIDSVRLLLRNEDCGVASLVDSVQLVDAYQTPLTISVPASACAKWSWAAEGQSVFAVGDQNARLCRGGDDSALASCASDDTCAEGGKCGATLAQTGVPYPYGWQYFQCVARGVVCGKPGADAMCCDERVRRWYAHATPALLYSETI